ncbi:hypothetical protein KI387_003166, partial [Taxus chinensis]
VEGVDFDENFVHVVRMEAIRLFLAYITHKGFKFYQMDVKSTFLNGHLNEEVYIGKLDGFTLTDDLDY